MDALALLRLQMEWGADEALEDEPVDRLRPAPARATETAAFPTATPARLVRPAPAVLGATPPAMQGTPAERAVAAAAQADSIDALRDAVAAFDGCALRDTATNTVFASGSAESGILLIGEPPGSDEDRGGVPFAGAQGELLDKMLASIDLQRSGLLLTHLIPWRPPGGRPPTASEIAVCLPFLHRLIALAEPRHVLILGALANRTLLNGPVRRRPPSDWQDCVIPGLSRPIKAIVAPSMAMLIKTPILRRDAWAALRMLRRAIP